MGVWNGELTASAVMKISRGDSSLKPVVQVTDLRKVPQNGQDRFRLQVSDGKHYFSGMLATQMNPIALSGQLDKFCVIQMNEYIMNVVQDKRILIVLDLQVLNGPLSSKIGTPVDVNSAFTDSGAANCVANNYTATLRQQTAVASSQFPANAAVSVFGQTTASMWSAEPWKPAASTAVMREGNSQLGMETSGKYFPIMSVNPYQNRWTIRGRISNRSPLRKYQNSKGDGVVMSFEIMDDSGSIKVACFREIAERMSDLVQMGKTFTISKAVIKQADKRYNRCTSDYEMLLGSESEVEPFVDDGSVASLKYHFVKIADLEKKEPGSFLNVLGIVQDVSDIVELASRTKGDQLYRRTITLVDDSCRSINLTLWGETAQSKITSADGHPTLLCKGVRRGEYQGLSLDGVRASFFELNPEIAEARVLKAWFDTEGSTVSAPVLNGTGGGGLGGDRERKSLKEMGQSNIMDLASDPKGVYFSTRATISMIKRDRDLWYTACPETNKKVTEIAPGRWHCAATDKEYDHCNYRYMLNLSIQDETANQWVSAFDEAGGIIFGKTADELNALRENQPDAFDAHLQEPLLRQFIMRIRAKQDNWNDEVRLRYSIVKIEPVNFISESKIVLNDISKYSI